MTAPAPVFSVLIPTRSSEERLAVTLDSIAAARFDPSRLEVVVLDDGSNDGTYETFRQRDYPFAFQIHRRDFANQSAATNAAASCASGTYLLSSAQDIIFHPDLLAQHLSFHEAAPDDDLVVLGDLPYAEHLNVTPFMFYLVNGGYQFAYYLIKDSTRVPPNFLYAPNFSVKRELFERVGGFDEQFPFGCQDTDLGIRLTEAGARMVFNRNAIGYHNHPVEMAPYLGRQESTGRALVHLELKHPDYEGGPQVWDTAIQQGLMYSAVDKDRDVDLIEKVEHALVSDHSAYKSLWEEAFCGRKPLIEFSEAQRDTLRLLDGLFVAYNRILGFHWARAYLAESVRVHGPERFGKRVRSRLAKAQASIPVWKVIDRRLRDYGLQPAGYPDEAPGASVIVHDVPDYLTAARFLESFQNPPAQHCNREVIVIVDPNAVGAEHRTRLREVAEVVESTDPDSGIVEALGLCRSETVAICSARVEPIHPQAWLLAEKLLSRVPRLAIVGGNIDDPLDGGRRYGYGRDGRVLVGNPVRGSSDPAPGITPIDVAIPEFLVLRRSAAGAYLENEHSNRGRPWNFEICELAARSRHQTVHVPELEVRYVAR